ncbi:SNF2-related protein [Streptomyces lavenduligriseus]|uniref:SNF2-related protein n=1 Tax=Streptomyces lavenduligriseus TaxID=67315 RepID=A0ABT0P667_9ACTN|nr:SNF2-related protein [Streptomyces lavenduligriseus]MCL3999083.1 SNF2-related protein [Streptomyces lavenduligriseus]
MSIDRLQPVSPAALAARIARPHIPTSRAEDSAEGASLSVMDAEAFRSALQHAVAQGTHAAAVAAEAARRIARGSLDVAALRTVLFETAAAEVWAPVRQAAITAVAASPALAPSIISMHAQLLRTPSATVREGQGDDGQPFFVAEATFAPAGGRAVTGSVQQARTRKGARQQAMTSLVAALADLPDPLAERAVPDWNWDTPAAQPQAPAPAGEANPVSALNEFHQAGHISRPDYRTPTPTPTGFAATVTAVHRGQQLTGEGSGPSKRQARAQAASRLLQALQSALDADTDPPAATERADTPAPPALPIPPAPADTQEPPRARRAAPADLFTAHRVLEQSLAAGAALTLLPSRHPAWAAWMLFQPDGTPLPAVPGHLPPPLQPVTRDLVLAGAGGIMPRRATVTGIAVPVGLALPALLTSRQGEHPSVTGWRPALRLALACVAQQRVYPALTTDGHGCWRIGPITEPLRTAVTEAAARMVPEGHCLLAGHTPLRVLAPENALWPLLDAVADAMVRTPAAAPLLGPGPFTSTPPPESEPTPDLWAWADAIEDAADPSPAPRLALRIKEPESSEQTPTAQAVLHLAADDQDEPIPASSIWDGNHTHSALTPAVLPGVRRALRRGARHFPPLGDLAAQHRPRRLTLSAQDLARLHDHAAAPLAAAGITVQWPPALLGALTATAVIGSHDTADEFTPGSGFLTLNRLVDCRWHISLDGDPLTEDEMTALANAVWPLIRLRGRWLLIDPDTARRARHRDLAPLPSLDALAAALSGTLTLGDETHDVRPTGTLAALTNALRQAPDAPRPVPPPTGLKASLRHYQQRALTWLTHTLGLGFGALLADDMGLGKTLTTIALHLHRAETAGAAAGPTLVVCPASLITNWQREIARFAPDTTVVRYHGSTRALDTDALDHTTVVITTYGTLRLDPALAATQWGLVVADEAQHIKNPTTATAKALRDVPALARLAVTGTPVENTLTDLWAILDWTNPGLLGTRAAFRARYGTVEKDPDSPAAAGIARLIAPFMLRRRKTDPGIAPELPGKVHHHRIVALTDEQTGLYEAIVRDTMHKITTSSGIERRGLVIKLLQALRQICNTPTLYLKEPLDAAKPADLTRRSGKLAALDDLTATLADRGEAALVFTGYVQMGHILEHHLRARGRSVRFLHGGTPPARRQELVDAFQHDPDPAPVFILSVKAAGTGLTLTRAEHVIHYDRPWNPAVEDQATDRAHRLGQRRTVQVHHLITEGTVEDHINALLARKRALTDAVLTSGEDALTELDNAELAALVTLGTR